MKIIIKNDGVVVAKGVNVMAVENGIFCDNCIYAEPDLSIVETSKEVLPFKNTLINDVVGINPVWTTTEEAIKQQAIDEYTLSLINGGII